VYIDGVYQNKDTYSVSGTTLTFSTAPPNGSAVEAMTIQPTAVNVPADASVTSAKLSGDLVTPGALNVTGTVTSDGLDVEIADNQASPVTMQQGGNSYFKIVTTNSSESVQLGNTTTNPDILLGGGNVGIGTVGSGASSATPVELNLGSTFANSVGSLSKAKLKLFEDSSANVYGLSVSSGLMEFGVPSSAGYAFFINESEKIRIDSSGNLLVGTTTTFTTGDDNTGAGSVFIATNGNPPLSLKRAGSNGTIASFIRGGVSSPVGSISITASATAYNTSSDQRLKENIVDAPSASDDIDAIQVRSFDWKADGSHQKYGMVAQELQGVAPEAVTGDADSDEMMGVDYSKLVPMMIKEIQSLRREVAALKENN